MVLNMNMWCDVARSADAAAAPLRAAGVTVTTAGAWQAPLVIGSGPAIQSRLAAMLLAVLDEVRFSERTASDAEALDTTAPGPVSVSASTSMETPGMLRVQVACGAATRDMLLPVMGSILV